MAIKSNNYFTKSFTSKYKPKDPNKNIFNNEEINKKYSDVLPYLNTTPKTIQQNIFKAAPSKSTYATTKKTSAAKKTETPAVTNTESISDILRANYPTLSGGGGSSYSGNPAGMVDISGMLKAFEQAADANKSVIQQSYDTRRNDLLTSLKRYQEQNAKDVAAQQKTYLANQALVESAIAEADRQNRINASARGLGGSGLQQLSQLQTLMSQGQTISDMASENQNTVNNLREVLANYDEDTQTALKDLETTKENSLKGVNSELASNKANLEYQAREAAANRAQMEASTNAQIAAQNAQYAADAAADERALNSQLATLQKNYENEISNIEGMSSKALNSLYGTKKADEAKKVVYNNYYANLGEIANAYGIGGTNLAASNYDTLESIYKSSIKPTVSSSTKGKTTSILGVPVRVLSSSESNTYNDLYNKYLKQTKNAYKAKQLAQQEFARLQ